jgi:hypothetical protein
MNLSSYKETKSSRKERIPLAKVMSTKIKESKKKYTRKPKHKERPIETQTGYH